MTVYRECFCIGKCIFKQVLFSKTYQTKCNGSITFGREQCLDQLGQSHCNKPSQASTLLAGCSRARCSLSMSRHKEALQILWDQIGKKQGEKGAGASAIKYLPQSA